MFRDQTPNTDHNETPYFVQLIHTISKNFKKKKSNMETSRPQAIFVLKVTLIIYLTKTICVPTLKTRMELVTKVHRTA
jgi:hypothetical protein